VSASPLPLADGDNRNPADDISVNGPEGVTAPLTPALAETLIRPLEIACDLEQESLRETILGMVHKLVRCVLLAEVGLQRTTPNSNRLSILSLSMMARLSTGVLTC
jgi:hypothetical protein